MNAILLVSVAFATLGTDPGPAVPLSVDVDRAEKGTVKAGPALRHSFTLKHAGTTGTLVFTGVETGCGCLRHSLSKLTLQPGESSQLLLEVNTLTQAEGPNTWHATVHTRLELRGVPMAIPTTGKTVVRIVANVEREIVVTPSSIAFSTTGEASQVVTVTDKRPGGTLKVDKAVTTSSHLTASIRPDGTILVSLAATSPADGKTYAETVTLVTADPNYSEFRIPVTVTKRSVVTGRITPTPDRFYARFATGEASKSTVVQLRVPTGGTVGIMSAASDHPGITVTFSGGSSSVAAVKATIERAVAGASGSANVTVLLATENGQTITIPLVWSGRP